MLHIMRLRAYASIFAISCLLCLTCCGGSTSSTPPPPVVESIAAAGGSGQSAVVGTPFATQLTAAVTSNASPVSGVVVTFTAPGSGASGTFASGANTAMTNASGIASVTFTANVTAGGYTVTASTPKASTSANFTLTNLAGAAAVIAATGGASQNAAINATFAPMAATVLDSFQNPMSGVTVTFAAPPSGASGTFANGSTSAAATTDANGIASATLTANGTVGGPYTANATAAGLSTPATFSLTNRAASSSYSFYLSGLQVNTAPGESAPYFYALAGSVTIEANGNVLAGEQDFNNGGGTTSPQPSGDTITGGLFTWVDAAAGQGTLTLSTNNQALGVKGVETLGVQFVNPNHALIIQSDGTATSSGSMDLQTLPSVLSGGYAFTFSVADPGFVATTMSGGIFSVSGNSLQNGIIDVNNAGTVTLGAAFAGSISSPDHFGRGTITGAGIAGTTNYYVVGPKAIRIIDMDTTDTGIGSAFGQGGGVGSFSASSLGTSVFGIEGNAHAVEAAVGEFTTVPGGGTFQGVADRYLTGGMQNAFPISGTYSVASNGYGRLIIAPGDLGSFSTFGIYLTDPELNLNDPNNATTGLGGGLLVQLDASAWGTGILVPQTDTSNASFAGNYNFGAQVCTQNVPGCEFDFIAQGSVTGGLLTGTGLISDPFKFLGANPTDFGATFAGPVVPDPKSPGRYEITSAAGGPFVISTVGGYSKLDSQVVIYQVSGEQLFWMDENQSSVFSGYLEKPGALIVIGPPAKGHQRQRE